MADIIKVKAKKEFEWEQDAKYLYIKLPMPGHTTIKHIQIHASDLVVRVTSKIKKSVETLDLLFQIDYLSAENKFVLIDSVINATLKKVTAQIWPTLTIENISLVELKHRRNQSQARYEANIKQIQETKTKLKTEHDRKATQEMMKFQEDERNKLNLKKEQERDQALKEVFKDVNEQTGKITKREPKHKIDTNWKQKQVKVLQQFQKEEEKQRRILHEQSIKKHQQKLNKINIFNAQDVSHHESLRNNVQQTEQIQQIPVRRHAKVQIKFTEKVYPHVATRDYHYTEPPMPKGQLPMAPSRDGELQNRNPLWLKDRGDQFARNKNYEAALQTYNEAMKIDGRNKKVLMNRSFVHMKLLNLESCISDCQQLLQDMQKELVNSQELKQQSMQNMIKIKTRKAICLAMKGKFAQSRVLLTELLSFQLSTSQATELQTCLSLIQKREASLLEKCKGDELVKRNAYSQAIVYYDKAIQIDRNQYALSNKSLCLNKMSRFSQSVLICDQGIKQLEEVITTTNQANKSPQYTGIMMKLMYRKAVAQEAQSLYKQSQHTLKKALLINPQDKDIILALSNLNQKKSAIEFANLKQEASVLLQKNQPAEALNIYTRCLKLCQSKQKLHDYLSIQQNQCVCYLKLQDYDSLVAVCIRIINAINNLNKRVVDFAKHNRSHSTLPKEVTDKILVRTLVRRANGYVNLGQVYNAKADLEKAIEIAPHDQAVKTEHQKLMKSLSAS